MQTFVSDIHSRCGDVMLRLTHLGQLALLPPIGATVEMHALSDDESADSPSLLI
jgi:hypothetical protein